MCEGSFWEKAFWEESFWEESFWAESFWAESFWEAMCKHAHINATGDAKGSVQAMLNNC